MSCVQLWGTKHKTDLFEQVQRPETVRSMEDLSYGDLASCPLCPNESLTLCRADVLGKLFQEKPQWQKTHPLVRKVCLCWTHSGQPRTFSRNNLNIWNLFKSSIQCFRGKANQTSRLLAPVFSASVIFGKHNSEPHTMYLNIMQENPKGCCKCKIDFY